MLRDSRKLVTALMAAESVVAFWGWIGGDGNGRTYGIRGAIMGERNISWYCESVPWEAPPVNRRSAGPLRVKGTWRDAGLTRSSIIPGNRASCLTREVEWHSPGITR